MIFLIYLIVRREEYLFLLVFWLCFISSILIRKLCFISYYIKGIDKKKMEYICEYVFFGCSLLKEVYYYFVNYCLFFIFEVLNV